MRQENNMYYAEPGKLIFRKSDDFIMGDAICLHEEDDINNYEERDVTEVEMNAFFDSIGIDIYHNKPNNLLTGINSSPTSLIDKIFQL